MMDVLIFNFRRLMLASCLLALASCATPKPASETESGDPPVEAARVAPEAETDKHVGTVAVVKSSASGKGFVLVRPASKQTRVDVGTTLESRDDTGLKTATMMRSAEDNRRFFVADIRDGMPSEGDSVIALAKEPELVKSPSGLLRGGGIPGEIDLEAPLSLPPLSEADIKAMEP